MASLTIGNSDLYQIPAEKIARIFRKINNKRNLFILENRATIILFVIINFLSVYLIIENVSNHFDKHSTTAICFIGPTGFGE